MLADLVIGVVGAILGGWVFGVLGIGLGGIPPIVGRIVVATLGAVLLIFIIRLVKRA